MTDLASSKTFKVALIGLAAIVALALLVIPAARPAQAQTAAEVQAQINLLLQQIAQLQAQLDATTGAPTGFVQCDFTRNLSQGASGEDVRCLQRYLNAAGFTVAATGAGSAGAETTFFGSLTRAAAIRWQEFYAAQVLTPLGLAAGTGFWGPASRAHYNALAAGAISQPPAVTPTTPPPTVAGALSVSAGTQPGNSLAPENAARVPFTNFTLTAGASDVVVDSVVVQRTGLAADTSFDNVLLLDANGDIVGLLRTLNSLHQSTIGDKVTIPAGQSRTFTIATIMDEDLDAEAGQVAAFSLIAINTAATVSGTLPITGANHTINGTLTIGSATTFVSSLDPNSQPDKEIGTTDYVFAAIRIQAGSAEQMRLRSIRWNQTGSAGSSDLANIVVEVDGVDYPTVVSSDGKFWIANFGNGIVIDKGFSKDVALRGDIIGGADRTIIFDIDRAADIYITGETFGYGRVAAANATATASETSSQFTTGTPFFDASRIDILAGNVTTVSKSNAAPSQNIAINVANQPLGAFEINLLGESISVGQMVFRFLITGTGGQVADITSVAVYNEAGAVVAGPVDGSGAAASGSATFTDTVTVPTGKSVYILKGRLNTDFTDAQTVQASTTPSTNWTNVTGVTTGRTITLPSSVVAMNTMTVRAATTTVSVSPTPTSTTVVMGKVDLDMVHFLFDGTRSGEDVRYNSVQFNIQTPTGASYPTNCLAYHEGVRLTNSAVNPSTDAAQTFTLSNPLVTKKGEIETLEIHCDIPTTLTNNDTVRWQLAATESFTGAGVTSSSSVTPDLRQGSGGLFTLSTGGQFTVELDSSSPAYAIAAGAQTNVPMTILKFRPSNEDVSLEFLGLQLTSPAASSTAQDLSQITLWNGATKVATGVFRSDATTTRLTLQTTVLMPKDRDTKLTVKVDLADIGTDLPATQGALVRVDYDGRGQGGATTAVGQSSGTSITATTTTDTATEGVRMFNTYPTFERNSLTTNTLSNGSLKKLLRYKVTANAAGDVGIYKFSFTISTTGPAALSVSAVEVYCYTASNFTSPCPSLGTAGGSLDNATNATGASGLVEIYAENSAGNRIPLQVPAGETRYFELTGTVSGSDGGDTVTSSVDGDAAYPSLSTLMATGQSIDADTNDDLIWSPNATTTSSTSHADWTNGFQVAGFPSAGISDTLSN